MASQIYKHTPTSVLVLCWHCHSVTLASDIQKVLFTKQQTLSHVFSVTKLLFVFFSSTVNWNISQGREMDYLSLLIVPAWQHRQEGHRRTYMTHILRDITSGWHYWQGRQHLFMEKCSWKARNILLHSTFIGFSVLILFIVWEQRNNMCLEWPRVHWMASCALSGLVCNK